MDWHAWHDTYGRADSPLVQRPATVQDRIRDALDHASAGPLSAVSVRAGQGHDLIGALAGHPRRHDVRARLVELDERNVAAARRAADAAGLPGSRSSSATRRRPTTTWSRRPPTSCCHCTRLCRTGGTVVWTRNRKAPDLVPQVCAWLEERGFERLWVSEPGLVQAVGAHRFTGTPGQLTPGERMFTFIGYDTLRRVRVTAPVAPRTGSAAVRHPSWGRAPAVSAGRP